MDKILKKKYTELSLDVQSNIEKVKYELDKLNLQTNELIALELMLGPENKLKTKHSERLKKDISELKAMISYLFD